MANNPYKNKIVYNGTTLIDLTGDTVTPSVLMEGYTAHDASGAPIVGSATGGGVLIEDTTDSHGGTIRTITTTNLVTLGQKSITQNGTYVASDDDYDGYSQVTVNVGGATPTYQTKSVTPTESSQTVTADTGYDALSSVSVGAISSTYVGSGITRRSSSDLTASGATVSVPSGYYSSNASKAVASGSVTAPSSISGTSATVSTGTNTLTLSKTVSVTPNVTTAGYISSGTAGNSSISLQASVTTQAAQTIYPSSSDQSIASGRYLTGAQTIKAVTTSNLTAANIKKGVTVTVGDSADADRVLSVTGTYEGGGGSTKNIQAYIGRASRTANSYGATDATLTVAKTGTYNVSWTAWRSSSQGTMGTNLYVNSTSGTNQQTWTNTYGQQIELTNQSYTAGDVLTLYATSGSNSRTINVANLIIEEQ